ncbi:MAG: hypothetical protein ACFFAN_03560 [Promethearchaeota archaeon]
MGDKKHIPLIGDVLEEVGYSPWDFYSWGHIAMGIALFLVFSLINTIRTWMFGPGAELFPWWLLMVFVLIIAFLWEVFENTLLWIWGKKFENRRDSFLNSLWDILFACIGGAVMWLFKWIIMDLLLIRGTWFYIVGIISFVLMLIAYFIGYFITNKQS